MSTRSSSQLVTPPRGEATQGMSTRSGRQLVTSPRGEATQGMSTHSGGQEVISSIGGVSQVPSENWGLLLNMKCRGYDFEGTLRRHLAHTTKNCKSQYSKTELDDLEEQAEAVRKQK